MAATMRETGRFIFRCLQQNSRFLRTQNLTPYGQRVRCLSKGQIQHNNVNVRAGRLTGAATAMLTGVATFTWVNNKAQVYATESKRPEHKFARQIKHESDHSGLKLTLYQYQTCPFCCKLRAFLDYHGFSYNVVEVNSVSRKQIKWSKYKKVPILAVDGVGPDGFVQLNDSSVIISILESYIENHDVPLDTLVSYYPTVEGKDETGKNKIDYPNRYFIMYGEKKSTRQPAPYKQERIWRRWVDDHLVHMISPNVYRTPSEALQTFHYFSDIGQWEQNFNRVERFMMIHVGATAMYLIGKMLKKKYKLKEDVRESLYDHCDEWVKAVGKNKFLGGDQPNLADLSVYGSLCSFEGCDAFQDALKHSKIGPWFHSMKHAVTHHQGASRLMFKS